MPRSATTAGLEASRRYRLSVKGRRRYAISLVCFAVTFCAFGCYQLHSQQEPSQPDSEPTSRHLLNAVEVIPGFQGNRCDAGWEEAAGGFFASVIYILLSVYLFLGIAVICDNAFVNSLEMICSPFGLNLSADVAGATFMAAGSSAPELATSFIGVFLSDSDVGIGTILGSAVFNILIIVGATAILSGRVLELDPRPIIRDNFFYMGSVVILVICILPDDQVDWWDNVMLLVWYSAYIAFLSYNAELMGYFAPQEQSEADEEAPAATEHDEAKEEQNPIAPEAALSALAMGSVVSDQPEEPVTLLKYHDYEVDETGAPLVVTGRPGQFRCAGDSVMSFGFQLTANEESENEQQQGHFLCLVDFTAEKSEVDLKFEYNMSGEPKEGGYGLCAYLLDPDVPGWDTEFNGTGPLGFLNKTGAILGVGFDNTGAFTGGDEFADHVTVKGAKQKAGEYLKTTKVEGGFMTTEDDWKTVVIKFDIHNMNCDVILDYEKILDDIDFGGMKLPSRLCVAVCGASTNKSFMISVNDVKLESAEDEAEVGSESAVGIGSGKGDDPAPKHEDPPSAPGMQEIVLKSEEEAAGGEGSEEEEEEPGWMERAIDIAAWPYEKVFEYTIPECQYEDIESLDDMTPEELAEAKANLTCGQRWYWAAFAVSLVWITILSYFMVEIMLKLGCIWGIPDVVMGLTFLAMGTSIPDALGSISVAKEGHGDMAVSNAVGSNVFDICVGLGLPWMIKAISTNGDAIKICDTSDVVPSIFILLGIIAVLFGVLWHGKWRLVPQSGYALFATYGAFIIYSLVSSAVKSKKECDH